MSFLPQRGRLAIALAAMSVSTLTCAFASAPGSATAPSRITQKIDSRNLAALAHNVRRELNATTDLGPVEDTLTLPRMHLILQRSPEQQAAPHQPD